MVKYLESTRNYFYKQYKNGKKKRISFEQYNHVMKGGENSQDEKYNLTKSDKFKEFIDFVKNKFTSNNRSNSQYKTNYNTVKTDVIRQLDALKSYIQSLNTQEKKDFPQIFYIYNNDTSNIIFIGVIDGYKTIHENNYKVVRLLLRRPHTSNAGITAVYHILKNLDERYKGICLASLDSSHGFYTRLGFSSHGSTYYLDKDKQHIETLESNSIKNTVFVSLFDKIY